MKNVKMIALTGGIGSGKTYALSVLEGAGYQTLSCDQITAELYQERKVKLKLKKMFPTAIKGFINPEIDRKEISRIVFSDKDKLEELTATVTPLVLKEVKKRAKKLGGVVFVEVPLLFERGYEEDFAAVIVITRPIRDRIESVKKRSNLSEEEIVARIKNQFDYENADLSEYTVILNDGDFINLKERVLSVAACLKE